MGVASSTAAASVATTRDPGGKSRKERVLAFLRAALGIVFLAGFVVAALDVVDERGVAGYVGVETHPKDGAVDTLVVTSAAPNAPVHVKDELRILRPDTTKRLGVQLPGTALDVRDLTTSNTVTLAGRGEAYTGGPAARFFLRAVRAIVIALALALVVFRGSTPEILALAMFLFTSVFFLMSVSDGGLGIRWREGYILVQTLGLPLQGFSLIALLVALSDLERASRRVLLIVGGAVAAALALYQTVGMAIVLTTGYRVPGLTTAIGGAETSETFIVLGIVAAIVVAVRGTEGDTRRRLVIVASAVLLGQASSLLDVYSDAGGFGVYDQRQMVAAGALLLVMTIGLLYAVLVEHLFNIVDVAMGQAYIFSGISICIVGFFVLIEWAVPKFVVVGREGNVRTSTEMALALGVGLFLRPIHTRLDASWYRVLYGKRGLASDALRRFADGVHQIPTRDEMLDGVLEAIQSFGRVRTCAIFVQEDEHRFPKVRGDAAAPAELRDGGLVVVELKAKKAPVRRADYEPLGFADIAFPMVVRGTVTGVIACTLPPHADRYSSDEIDAFVKLANEVGTRLERS